MRSERDKLNCDCSEWYGNVRIFKCMERIAHAVLPTVMNFWCQILLWVSHAFEYVFFCIVFLSSLKKMIFNFFNENADLNRFYFANEFEWFIKTYSLNEFWPMMKDRTHIGLRFGFQFILLIASESFVLLKIEMGLISKFIEHNKIITSKTSIYSKVQHHMHLSEKKIVNELLVSAFQSKNSSKIIQTFY